MEILKLPQICFPLVTILLLHSYYSNRLSYTCLILSFTENKLKKHVISVHYLGNLWKNESYIEVLMSFTCVVSLEYVYLPDTMSHFLAETLVSWLNSPKCISDTVVESLDPNSILGTASVYNSSYRGIWDPFLK